MGAIVVTVLISGLLLGGSQKEPPQKLPPRKVREQKEQGEVERLAAPENSQSVDEEIMRDWDALSGDELLAWVAGVPTQNAGLLTEKVVVNMRGIPGRYGAQRVAVLLDGIPLNEEYMGDVDFRFIPFEAVGNMRVLRGVAGAEFGRGGTAGAILLETLEPARAPAARLRFRVGDYNTENYSVVHGGRHRRLRWLAAGGYARTDGYITNPDGTQHDWEMARGLGKFTTLLTPSIAATATVGGASGHGASAYFDQETSRDFQAVRIASQIDPKRVWDFSALLWRNGLATDYNWRVFPFKARYRQHTLGVRTTGTLRSGNHTVKGGVCYTESYARTHDVGGAVEGTIYSTTLFIEDTIHYRRFRARFGARYDDDSISGGAASPRLCGSVLLKKWLAIRGAVGRTWRPPSLSDLYLPDTNYGSMVFRGNPDLKPETAWTYELGARIFHTLLARNAKPLRLRADASIFYTDARAFYDYVVVGTQGGLPLLEPRNIPRISISGAELSARLFNLLPGLHLLLNYAYIRARYREYPLDPTVEGNNLEYIPSHYGTAAIIYTPSPNTTLIFWCRASDHRNTDIHNWKDLNLPGYAILGVRAAVLVSDLKTARIRLLVSVDNLTDREYEEYRGVPAPGRRFGACMEVTF